MNDPRIEDLADFVLTKWEDGDDVRSLTTVLADEIAAAEERGRRRGVEGVVVPAGLAQRILAALVNQRWREAHGPCPQLEALAAELRAIVERK